MLIYPTLYSQENSIFENYYLSPSVINPATSGAEYHPTANIAVKRQWSGFPDTPTTFILTGCYRLGSFDFYDLKGMINKGPLRSSGRVGLGGTIFRDVNGPMTTTGVIIAYAYHIPLNDKSSLSLGLSALGTWYTFNNALLKPDEPNDPYLMSGNDNIFRPNFNLGAYYYHQNFFIGFSANRLLPDIMGVNDNIKTQPGFFLMGGYKFLQNTNSIIIEPSIMINKPAGNQLSVDIHTKLYIKRLHWIALSYSTTQRINLRFGIRLYKMLYAGYNYEYTLGELASYQFGSHEIHLGINLGLVGIEGTKKMR
ncbi:MAG: PorP/SprF family type IX secretion system membrane protein [Bacteroidales bacterium]|nr:PorP/SprF family type IX secretion system membrane protein [Bacteroidales bacterium]